MLVLWLLSVSVPAYVLGSADHARWRLTAHAEHSAAAVAPFDEGRPTVDEDARCADRHSAAPGIGGACGYDAQDCRGHCVAPPPTALVIAAAPERERALPLARSQYAGFPGVVWRPPARHCLS